MENMHMDPMDLKKKESTTNGLGVAGLITGILTLFLAFVPCIGIFAIIFGVVSIVLCAIGLKMASNYKFPKGMLIAGLITAILGSILAITQIVFVGGVGSTIYEEVQKENELRESGYYDYEYEYYSQDTDSIIKEEVDTVDNIYEADSLK